jgi:hypothetical protein
MEFHRLEWRKVTTQYTLSYRGYDVDVDSIETVACE